MIWRLRDRDTFLALAQARRHRAGPVWLRCTPGQPDVPPRVGYAIGKRVGNAVVRNRIRRRLRAAIGAHESKLVPGSAYLFGADTRAMTMPFAALETAVATLLDETSP